MAYKVFTLIAVRPTVRYTLGVLNSDLLAKIVRFRFLDLPLFVALFIYSKLAEARPKAGRRHTHRPIAHQAERQWQQRRWRTQQPQQPATARHHCP